VCVVPSTPLTLLVAPASPLRSRWWQRTAVLCCPPLLPAAHPCRLLSTSVACCPLDVRPVAPCSGARTMKDGGCNHITCKNCAYEYCWLCSVQYASGHFATTMCSQVRRGRGRGMRGCAAAAWCVRRCASNVCGVALECIGVDCTPLSSRVSFRFCWPTFFGTPLNDPSRVVCPYFCPLWFACKWFACSMTPKSTRRSSA